MEDKTDLRIKKTYYSLRVAFTELLEEKRFEDITVGELCERAMIRRTTFYKHFADKYEYFTFYIKELRDLFESQLSPDIASGKTEIYFTTMGLELFRFMNQHERLVRHIMESNMLNVLIDLLHELIEHDLLILIRGEHKKTDNKPEFIAAFYAGGLLSSLRWYIENGVKVSEDEFVKAVEMLVKTSLSDAIFE
ncbi:MAG: TetR/AcrR family transcriptional regulator [Clostridiales bacterium]|nr:TetR/AcrR family transcriptional regulator [Clostridiales bacterium]